MIDNNNTLIRLVILVANTIYKTIILDQRHKPARRKPCSRQLASSKFPQTGIIPKRLKEKKQTGMITRKRNIETVSSEVNAC